MEINNKYQNGKIYKICDINETEIYIGSTTQPLYKRLSKHKGNYKEWMNKTHNFITSFKLFEKFGLENCQIILIENYPCKSKEELNAREAYHIRLNNCVNKIIPGRTHSQWQQDNKQYVSEYNKKYRIDNIDKINANVKQKEECLLCDCIFKKRNKHQHFKTKKHIDNEKVYNDILNGLY
jgi:hypothetical protein